MKFAIKRRLECYSMEEKSKKSNMKKIEEFSRG
jgi:hypothetical protein